LSAKFAKISDLSRENFNELISNAFSLTATDAHTLKMPIMKRAKGNALFAHVAFSQKKIFHVVAKNQKMDVK